MNCSLVCILESGFIPTPIIYLRLFRVAAVSGQRLANLTKEKLTKMRTDQSFDHFYATVARKSEGQVGEPTLPRKRRTPVRLVHQAIPKLPKITLEGSIVRLLILSSVLSISVSSYAQMETTLLVKAANGDDYEAEFKLLKASYSEDVDTGALPEQLSILEVMLKEKVSCFDEILFPVSEVSRNKRSS